MRRKWLIEASKGDTSHDMLRRFLGKRKVYIICTDVPGLYDHMGIS